MAVKTFTSVRIGNEFKKEVALVKIAKLQQMMAGSFYNFNFAACPVGGSFDIIATSDYEFSGEGAEKEMANVLLFMIVGEL